MPDRYIIDRFLSALYGIVREKLHYFLIDTPDAAFIKSDPSNQAHDTFGHGIDIHCIPGLKSMPAVIIKCSAIFDDVDLTDIAFVSGALGNESVQLFFIHYEKLLLGIYSDVLSVGITFSFLVKDDSILDFCDTIA